MQKILYRILLIAIGLKILTTLLWIPFWGFDIPVTGSFSVVFSIAVAYGNQNISLLYAVFLFFLTVCIPIGWALFYALFWIHPRLKWAKKPIGNVAVIGLLLLNFSDVLCGIISVVTTPTDLAYKITMVLLSMLWMILLILYRWGSSERKAA